MTTESASIPRIADPCLNDTIAYWMPWTVNRPLVRVHKKLYQRQPRRNAAAMASRCYVGPGLEMAEFQAVEARDDVPSEKRVRYSNDNGHSWSAFEPLPETLSYPGGIEVWQGGVNSFHDAQTGVLVEAWLRQIQVGNIWKDGVCNCFTYTRISRDLGRTWSAPQQLKYETGADFDPAHPFHAAFLLRNQAYPGNNFIRLRDGTLVFPVAHANDPSDPDNDRRAFKLGAVCFTGRWNPVTGDYAWTAGTRVAMDASVSSRGLMEPGVAQLADGRVLVVWRGSNTDVTPGHKWFSLSADGGRTLSPPAEWRYDDGTMFFSPSSIHQFLQHSVTGKLYWFGNITPTPPSGNSPRYPLIMAEVDEDKAALKKSTATLIDTRPPGSDANYQLSNFLTYENRETHAIEFFLTTYGQEPGAENWMNADCHRYELEFATESFIRCSVNPNPTLAAPFSNDSAVNDSVLA